MRGMVRTDWYHRLQLVFLRGQLDGAAAAGLRTELAGLPDPSAQTLVLNLEPVSALDSTALTVLLELAAACRRADVPFLICSPRPAVRQTLTAQDVHRQFIVAPTLRAAVSLAEAYPPPRPRSPAGDSVARDSVAR